MLINWTVRLRNKAWWIAIIPAIFLLVQTVLQLFGVAWDYDELLGKALAIVEVLFAVLVLVGVNVDPTTESWSDSTRALTYSEPAPNAKETLTYEAKHMDGGDVQ